MSGMEGNNFPCFLGLVVFLGLGLFGTAQGQLRISSEEGRPVWPISVEDYCMGFIYDTATDNVHNWLVPSECEDTVARYMTQGGYQRDVWAAVSSARKYFAAIKPEPNDAVVFDIDDTLISNMPYYAVNRWGTAQFDAASWEEWAGKAAGPALEDVRALYNELKDAGWVLVLLTGREESDRNHTTTNLLFAGYRDWFELMLRKEEDEGVFAVIYKSARREELEKRGYKVRGCVGDQWSDLRGKATGDRVFKLPNPIYYIS